MCVLQCAVSSGLHLTIRASKRLNISWHVRETAILFSLLNVRLVFQGFFKGDVSGSKDIQRSLVQAGQN